MKNTGEDLSVIIPAKNEESGLRKVLPLLKEILPHAEIIVVNDGSTDATAAISMKYGATKVVSHPYSKGNGAAIKTGARNATRETVLCMDADSQHDPSKIHMLIGKYYEGYHMVVGARRRESQASFARAFGNGLYNRLASWVVGHKIQDLTSGFRVVNRKKFLSFIDLLPNGFSYPTTITMAFFKVGYSVGYVEVPVYKRLGKSHLSVVKDGFRFFLIIFKIATLHSPLKIFIPFALAHLVAGLGYYLYTYLAFYQFRNMSLLMISLGTVIFLMGLLSEQITALYYKDKI
ncbi:glycosyltransferase family 2 protein [Ketobacter sp. MCCC 1A13808]|uniref:glycosyltransferase family 2 protein n=1 Tax=Ketobacter sp. MCCC 1A13808 TaxID=2602738 RepID=UPI0012EBB7C4|nr:glycosyltransferase family 2 protein [Ketobacter sp. MCCC 1A13808]MVF11185.1 glycosyltransferase family 2 protein [Ketobacter sp. MCCC 1A13808]